MSEAPEVLHLLQRIEHRVRLTQWVRVIALCAAAALFAGVVARALVLTGTAHPALWAMLVLIGILGGLGFVCLLLKEAIQGRCSLGRAAAMADLRAGLKDEITSAYWFMKQSSTQELLSLPGASRGREAPHPTTQELLSLLGASRGREAPHPTLSDWVRLHIERATQTARKLDPARLIPLSLPRSTWAAAVLAAVFVGLSFAKPLPAVYESDTESARVDDAQAAKARSIRNLLKQTSNGEVARKLEEALSALERKNATEEEKRKALAEAKEAVDKSNMEMNSMREGLMQLAERLRNTREKSSTGDDKASDRADRAKELLERMLDQKARQPHSADLDPESLAREKALEKLLEQAAKVGGQGDGQHFESAQPKAVVDRLEKIAQQLEQSASANSAVRELTQMQQLQVAQTSIQSAGRYSSSQQSQTPPTGTPSPDTGNTVMSGGIMFRTAAVAKGDKPSQTQEGSKSGAAAGDSPADPVIGKKETPLAVKLKKEGVRKEGEDGETGAEGWFYTESRAQSSQIALQAVRANTRYTQAEAMDPETISVKHRQVVKDYFLNLHQKPVEAKTQ